MKVLLAQCELTVIRGDSSILMQTNQKAKES